MWDKECFFPEVSDPNLKGGRFGDNYPDLKKGGEWIKSSSFVFLRIIQSGHVNCPFFEIGHFVLCLRVCVT